MSLRPSLECVVAATGQTSSQGAFSQCMHSTAVMRPPDDRVVALVVAVDADPVHLAAARYLVLADNRNVVLRLAGHHAGVDPVQALRSIAMPQA